MKRTALAAVSLSLLATGSWAADLLQVPADQVQKLAPLAIGLVNQQVSNPPVKVNAWAEKSQAFAVGKKMAVAVAPDKAITEALIAGAGNQVVPIGMGVFYNGTLHPPGGALKADRFATVGLLGLGPRFNVFFLAVHAPGGEPQLEVYSKEREPLLTVPLTRVKGEATAPMTLKFDTPAGTSATQMVLGLAGGYQAVVPVSPVEADPKIPSIDAVLGFTERVGKLRREKN